MVCPPRELFMSMTRWLKNISMTLLFITITTFVIRSSLGWQESSIQIARREVQGCHCHHEGHWDRQWWIQCSNSPLAWWSQSRSHWQVRAFHFIYWLKIFFFVSLFFFCSVCLLVLTCATWVHLWDLSTLAVIWARFAYKYITKSKFYQIS